MEEPPQMTVERPEPAGGFRAPLFGQYARRPRQAVVVLHGMGQQRVMETLRSFVETVVEQPTDTDARWYVSRPDKLSESDRYDERRLVAPPHGDRVQTEFYEYHWAHLMTGNKLSHMLPLARSALLRWPANLRIAVLWAVAWILVLGAVATGVALVITTDRALESAGVDSIVTYLGATGVWGWVLARVLNLLLGFVVGTLADFARYNNAAPENQAVRDVIRKGLVDLLDDVHEATIVYTTDDGEKVELPKYDRIIVASHSLGSIVAYEAMSHLWARRNKLHAEAHAERQFSAEKFERVEEIAADLNDPDGQSSVDDYQRAQTEAWIELRSNGNPWRITDFVTFGNPMAQSHQLLARSRDDLRDQMCRKELAACPPQPDTPEMTGPRPSGVDVDEWTWCKKSYKEQKAAHDAGEWHYWWPCSAHAPILAYSSMFAVIRWTNLWYPADLFGGPLADLYGKGIRDIEVEPDGLACRIPVLAHIRYLSYPNSSRANGAPAAIRRAIELDALPWLEGVPRLRVDPDSANHTHG